MDFMSYAFEGSGVELAAETFTGSGRLANERNLKSAFCEIDETVSRPNNEGAELMELGLGDMLLQKPAAVCDPCLRGVSSSAEIIDNDFAEMVLSHHPVTTVLGRIPAGDMEVEAWLPRFHNWKTSSASIFNLRPEENMKSDQLFKARSIVETEKGSGSGAQTSTNFPVLQVYDDGNKKMKSGQDSKEKLLDSEASATTVKRARMTNGLSSHPPICQVHDCFRDLSSSKDYYRRHRVCNEHSKTTKVIVDGIEQRFCQQCSRFHLLSEFDDEKRSCRKSLAGHNERRRKPQFDTHHGPRLFDMSLQTAEPFFLPELLPVNNYYFCQELENNSSRSIKMDDEKHISFSKLGVPKWKGQKRADPSKKMMMMIQEFSTAENNNSSCAHPLLSAHSQIQMPENILTWDWDFGKASGIRRFTSNQLCSAGVIEMEGSSNAAAVDGSVYYEVAEIDDDENFKSAQSCTTIDLEQLSTHLQRVEHQRNSAQTNQAARQ